MRRIEIGLVTLGLALAAVGAGAADVVRLDPNQMQRAGVAVEAVSRRTFGDQERVVGQVMRVPGSTLTLKAVIPGRVEELKVAPGDRVRAGQVLVELHSHDLLTMQASLLQARERASLAATRLEAGRELYAIEGMSRLELEEREQEAFATELEFNIARTELLDHGYPEAALEQVLSTRTTDPHLPVFAPVGGVILELAVQNREWVEEFATLLVMGDPDRIELELQIAPDRAAAVGPGDEVVFSPVGQPGMVGRASVVSKVPQVDPGTRTIKLRAEIVEGTPELFPGVFVEGTVAHGDARSAAAVPDSAVINVAGDDVVFVERGEGTFELRPVTLGAHDGDHHEVVAGVAVGDRIASKGVFLLKSTWLSREPEDG